eukprot:scaffold271219_cov22-Tisochrysis_lutea.AAC.2
MLLQRLLAVRGALCSHAKVHCCSLHPTQKRWHARPAAHPCHPRCPVLSHKGTLLFFTFYTNNRLQARPAAPPCYPKCSAQHSYMGGLPGFCTRQGLQPPCPLASVRGCRKGHSVV